jgi:tRNA U34 5-methylaminomethyl-2-thiouridine-forming methyltransferase MnmC
MLELVSTADGSKTIFNSQVGEHYHSRHGAVQESRHVFVHSGMEYFIAANPGAAVSILEIGFGTGLNLLLSANHAIRHGLQLDYTGIEAYPLTYEQIAQTGYSEYVTPALWENYLGQYSAGLKSPVSLSDRIVYEVDCRKLLDFRTERSYDVIYFDAFAAIHQPEMWEPGALAHACSFLKPGGVFVTYAITGNLKRAMKALGFSIEKAKGAPGKREMLRAVKLNPPC